MASPLGNITGGVVGAGVGIAAANVAVPVLEVERQQAWRDNAYRVLELGDLARLVAQGLAKFDDAAEHAQRNGFDKAKLAARVQLALAAPPYAEVLDLWRRNATRPPDEQISEEQVNHALAKAQIEPQYWPALKELISSRLSAQQIALGIVRSVIKDPGLLPVDLDTSGGVVPAYQVSDIDALAEALASGVNRERLRVMVGEIGLPMSTQQAASAYFRQIIRLGDYNRSVLEGDVRPEWAAAILEQAREILSATMYAESHLRGYTPDLETMFDNMAKHGMSREDAELLFLNQGRPLAIHQITTGIARGGEYDGPTDAIPRAYLDAVRQSNIKPPYYNLDFANRYSYPTGFMIRAEAQAKRISPDDTRQILSEIGWSPKWSAHFATSWSTGTAAQKEATVADILARYDGERITRAEARAELEALDYPADEAEKKLDVPDARRVIAARNTAISDLHSVYKKGAMADPIALTALASLGVADWAAANIVQAWRAFLTATQPAAAA